MFLLQLTRVRFYRAVLLCCLITSRLIEMIIPRVAFFFVIGCFHSVHCKCETMSSFRFWKMRCDAEFFLCAFFLAFGHIISRSVRHFPMLLHLNNHEVHKFIILLWESSFWYFFLYALRTHSHYWLHFPPTYFLLMECVDCVSPRCRSCCCFVGFFPSSLTLLPLFFMISLFLSSHQWDLGPHSVEILKTVEELSPNVLFVFLPGELFCRRVGFLHPVVLVSEVVHTLITLCPSRGCTKIVKRPFFHPIGGSILPFPYELSSCVILK